MGSGPARAHDFWVQNAVKRALLNQIAHVFAAQLFLSKAGKLLVHAVDPQACASGITDKNAFGQGV